MSKMLFTGRYDVWKKANMFLLALSIFSIIMYSAPTSMNFLLAVLR